MVECTWEDDSEEWEESEWRTSCGHMFTFIEDGPEDNEFKYCCYCGGELIIDES